MACRINDSFGDTYDNVIIFFKCALQILCELFKFKRCFRKVNKKRVISFALSCQYAGSSKPAGMASHDFHNRDRFLLVYRSIQSDFTYCGSHISGGASIARGVIGQNQVIVNGLRDADKTDSAANAPGVAGQLAYGIHGVIAADIEKGADIHAFQLFE